MVVGDAVVEVGTPDGQGALVVAQRLGATGNLVARTLDEFAVPVVFAVGGIDGLGVVPCVRQRQVDAKVVEEEMAFLIVGGEVPGICLPLCHAHHLGLYLSGLYLFVHPVVGGADEEVVGPPLVLHTDFQLAEQREIVVVEPAAVGLYVFPAFLVPYLHVLHHVVVLRIVDAEGGADVR